MKTGIIGRPGAGKTTVFEALTRNFQEGGTPGEARLATVFVPDERIDVLSRMYHPQKTIYAQVEYFLPSRFAPKKESSAEDSIWQQVRNSDALIHVVPNFPSPEGEERHPASDFRKVDEELVISDLVVVEKRLERLEADHKRGKKADPEEMTLLTECRTTLEAETPLRKRADLATAPKLRGFTFLSAKPLLVLFNNADDDDELPEVGDLLTQESCLVIRAGLERELAQMTEEEAEEFLKEFEISASAADRVIRGSYELLGLISFFTVGEDEVRAWTIPRGTPALEAAGEIHSDIQKGFIRAEVVSYDDLMAAGNFNAAKKAGTVRLEGKTYEVQDGDIINFRFNV